MIDELIAALQQNENATIETEIGLWRMHCEPMTNRVSPHDPPVEFNWWLEGLTEVGTKLLGGKEAFGIPIYVSTRLYLDGQVDYELFFRRQDRPVSVSKFEFRPHDSTEQNVVHYLELMDDLLQIADGNIQQYAPIWLRKGKRMQTGVVPTEEPPKPPKPDILQVIKTGNEDAIVAAARGHLHWKADEIIELYMKAKELRSNKLMNLANYLSQKNESLTAVDRLLQ